MLETIAAGSFTLLLFFFAALFVALRFLPRRATRGAFGHGAFASTFPGFHLQQFAKTAEHEHADKKGHEKGHEGGAGGGKQLLPFAWGSREYNRPLFSIPFVSGALAAQQKILKSGWIAKTTLQLSNATATVSAAGSAGTPSLYGLIQSYRLAFNGGFLYRSLDGECLQMIAEVETFGSIDPYSGSPQFANYLPASATAQPIGFVLEDDIALNLGANVDKFLLAAHARNADITLDITFGTAANVAANTETVTFVGTFLFQGVFMLDPNYQHFALPDLGSVQQWILDAGYAGTLVVGDNTVNLTPVQGPQYLQLLFKIALSSTTVDPQGVTPALTRLQLLINTGEPYIDMPGSILHYRNTMFYGRKLPAGWYVLNFLDDIGLVNTASSVARNVLSTDYIATLQMIATIAAGTTIAAGNVVKLLKRLKYDVARA